MPTNIDLNEMLDLCADCGARAGFEYQGKLVRPRCSDCCNTGDWSDDPLKCVIPWNKDQRKALDEP